MRTTFFLALVCFFHSTRAATYYFSSSSGDDSRSSTQAKNSSTPWKTLNKLNSFFSSLQPGDAVLFKRGETFYGSIIVNKSGTSGSPIVIGAYGSGSRPVITSLVTLSGWTANSTYSGVYDCSANASLGSIVNMVLLNDVEQAMGRYPNSDASNKGYLTLESHSGKTSITDNQLTSSPNWKGAELVIRTSHWVMDRYPITSHSGSTLYFSGTSEPRNNYGYFIQNSIKTLDRPGEWYYNPSTKKISMYFGSKSPSSYTVKATAINNLIYADSKSYVVFDNLTLKGANENCVDINYGSYISVTNSDILFSGRDGVNLTTHYYFKLENCTVLNSYNNGVAASASNRNATIRNNVVKNTYYKAGMGQSGQGVGAGIRISNAGIVEYNQVKNAGSYGITMGGDYTVVRNNLIDTFSFVKDDVGAIYMSSDGSTNYGRKITGNIVLNGIGAAEGTNVTFSSADGIYMDGNVNGVEITGNTIANSNRGIYLHNSRNIIVRNNTSFNNIHGQLHMKYDGLGGLLRNHTITNNVFFSKYEKDPVSVMLTKKDDNDIASFGRIDSNYYARPMNNTDIILTTTYVYTSSQIKANRDLPEWKSKYNKDHVSKLSTKTIAGDPDNNIKFVFNASRETKTIYLGGTYVDAKNIKYASSIELKPYTSAVLVKDGSSTTENIAPTVSITSPSDNSSFKAPAAINISAVASDNDGSVSKVEFYNGTNLLHTELTAPYGWGWNNVPAGTYSITAKATDNEGKTTTSAVVKVSVGSSTGNTAPVVAITTPVTNTSYTAPATVNMIASATDGDGTIKKVEFYNGTKLLHTEYQGTYSYSWTNVAAGTYTITAKATDDDGATTTSAPVKITVAAKSYRTSNNNQLVNVANNSRLDDIADFKLFPNPAVNTIRLDFGKVQSYQKATLVITNLAGNILKRYPIAISGKYLEVDLSSLNTGVFIISIATKDLKINKQFVKIN